MIGHLTDDLLDTVLETMPLQISVIDADDKVLAWNKHEMRLFKRPEAVLGKDVRDCHPKKSLPVVEQLLDEMKAGTRDSARFWIDMAVEEGGQPRKILIEYYALRSSDGAYMGCLEAARDVTDARALEGEHRLLD